MREHSEDVLVDSRTRVVTWRNAVLASKRFVRAILDIADVASTSCTQLVSLSFSSGLALADACMTDRLERCQNSKLVFKDFKATVIATSTLENAGFGYVHRLSCLMVLSRCIDSSRRNDCAKATVWEFTRERFSIMCRLSRVSCESQCILSSLQQPSLTLREQCKE